MLTPYDILRLKRHLHIKAEEFLDRYTEVEANPDRHLPMVYLQMLENDSKTCPFVTPKGCQVYPDRPSACRTYPLARATRLHRVHQRLLEDYFLLQEEHCKGFEQDRIWKIEEWIADQELDKYHNYNNLWMDIVTHPKLRTMPSVPEKYQQMFFLASYSLDRFRDFLLHSRFLTLFEIINDSEKAFCDNDEALLLLAFSWLKFSLFGEPTLKVATNSKR